MSTQSLKPGWKLVKFGEVVKNANLVERDPEANGVERIVGLEHIDPENLHIRRWNSVADGTSFTRKFVPGQTLFGKRRAYQRKVAYSEFEGICSGDILTFEPKNRKVLLPELLPFICQSDAFFDHALDTSAGSLSPRTSWTALKDFEFSLPPLDEQKRIAEILWAADETVNAFTSSLSVVQQSRNALLNELATKEHPQMPLGQVLAYASDGPFGSKLKTEHYSDSGAIVVRLQNISPLRYDDSDKAYIPIDYFDELRRYSLQAGDILVAGLGDEAHPVGRACIVPESLGPAINKADCFCLRPRDQIILSDYLCYYLNSNFARKEVMRITQGTTRFRINVSNLKTINTVVPDLEEQRHFIQRMKQIDICEKRLEGHLQRSRQLARNLLPNMIFGGDAHV
ncbi:MAG: restriction endonuclease subunit S [Syntrophobacter sp.]